MQPYSLVFINCLKHGLKLVSVFLIFLSHTQVFGNIFTVYREDIHICLPTTTSDLHLDLAN